MSLHKMTAGAEGKSDVVSTNPAAGSVTVTDVEIALWIGNTLVGVPNIQQSVFAVVNDLLERMRENGTPTPNTGNYLMANASFAVEIPRKPDIITFTDVSFAPPAETDVRIYVGDLFQPLPGTSVSTAVKRLLETWMEIYGKKAA